MKEAETRAIKRGSIRIKAAEIQAKHLSTGIAMQIFAMMLGLALSRTAIFGGYAPFGLALCMGLPINLSVAGTLGVSFGYLFPASGLDPMRYITASLSILILRILLKALLKKQPSEILSGVIVFFSGAVTGIAAASVNGFEVKSVIMYCSESLIAAAMSFFFARAFHIYYTAKGYKNLATKDLTCCVITIGVILLSLSGIQLLGFSPARAVAVIAVLAAARYGREQTGAIAGISAGFLLSLCGDGYLFMAAAFALGGLVAGVFAPLGKFSCTLAFVLCNAIFSIRVGATAEVMSVAYEVFAGSLIFMLLPKVLNAKLMEFFSPAAELSKMDTVRKRLTMRLAFAGAALSDVSETVDEVSKRLSRITAPKFNDIFERVESDACRNCSLRIHCFETARAKTVEHIIEMTKVIRKYGSLKRDNIPQGFSDYCPAVNDVAQSVLRHFNNYLIKESAERRIEEVRSVVSDQFAGISDMLYDISEEFESAKYSDIHMAEDIDNALKTMGIVSSDISCAIDKYGRISVEITVKSSNFDRINRKAMVNEISAITGRTMSKPYYSEAGKDLLITVCEKANYKLDFGAAQYACSKSNMCGDAFEYFTDGKCHDIMILSDGMGSGGRAAVDGAMASGLMGRLIRAGFGYDCSLKIVNSAMLFKSTDESLATLDITSIDLYSGECEFLKAGAGPTIVRRDGKTGIASCSSLPAGILREVAFDSASVSLKENDIVLVASDGVTADGTDWICAELESYSGGAQQLAERIAQGARRRRDDGHEDDITVMAAIIERNS